MPLYTLLIGAYSGKISTLHFDPTALTLSLHSTTTSSSPGPSWQDIEPSSSIVFSTNEGDEKTGGFVDSYKLGDGGKLEHLSRAEAGVEVVSIARTRNIVYAAAYNGPSISSYQIINPGYLKHIDTIKFELSADHAKLPNVNADRQDTSHPHQVLIDPTSRFLLVCDLGADLIRVFKISTTKLIQQDPVVITPGAGPRHIVFDKSGNHMYLVEELSNMISLYSVTSPWDDEKFEVKLTQRLSTLGRHKPPLYLPQALPKPAEVVITKDSKHLYVSNRFDNSKETDGEDTIAHYLLKEEGMLEFMELYKAGGINIRHFGLSRDEEFVGVACQDSGKVMLLKRDTEIGRIGGRVAEIECEGPVCVNWL